MNSLLKIERSLVTATVATFALTLPLAAQSGSRPDPRRTAPETAPATSAAMDWSPRLVRHDEIVGKTVRAGSGSGSTNGSSTGDEPTELGEITDLVIHRADGSVRYAILTPSSSLEIGEEPRLLPWDKLQCGEKNAITIADRKALGTMAKFDPENPSKSIRVADAARREGVSTVEAGTRRDGRATDADGAASKGEDEHECLMATHAGSWTVHAKDQDVGTIDALFVEVGHGTVAFVVVGTGGVIGLGETERPIPWQAISWTLPKDDEDEDAEPRINLAKTAKQLESSPQLGDEGVDLTKADHRKKVYEYFGVDKPKFESAPSKKDEDDGGRRRR